MPKKPKGHAPPRGQQKVSDEAAQQQWVEFLNIHRDGIEAFDLTRKEEERLVSMLACAFGFGLCCPDDALDTFPVTLTGRETIH
jgi:hypothetical protein